jgi:hypothetical protein
MQILIASTKTRASNPPPTNALTRNNRQKPYHLESGAVKMVPFSIISFAAQTHGDIRLCGIMENY